MQLWFENDEVYAHTTLQTMQTILLYTKQPIAVITMSLHVEYSGCMFSKL